MRLHQRLWRSYGRRTPWTRRLLVLLISLTALGLTLWFTPTPWYITAPGAAVDTGGMVAVAGGSAHPGRLFMLVVTTQPANLFWYLYAKLDLRAELETPQQFLGDIEDYDKYLELTRRMMADSKQTAMAIGLKEAGYGRGTVPVGAEITDLAAGSPNQGVFQPGDVIIAIEGRPVSSASDLRTALQGFRPGDLLAVRVKRGGKELDLRAATAESTDPARKGQPVFGIFIKDSLLFDVPLEIRIKTGAITGPSAGLMFTLQIVDQLTPGGITRGKVVAGTGTVEADGSVGAIGGVRQKVFAAETAGANVIFVPRSNYPDAAGVATHITVVPVDRVEDALAWLRSAEAKGGAWQRGSRMAAPPFGNSRGARE
ncbi:MAG TPA: S16 family serine protease [Symbiobacteriaceae bacterium]|nr:S16 family serine protease [Symbiobacteriaceae bacterium]